MRFFASFIIIVGVIALNGCGCETGSNPVAEGAKEWVPFAEGYYFPFEAGSGKDTLDVISYKVTYSTYNPGKGECGYREEQINISLVSSDVFEDTIHFELIDDVITVRKGANSGASIDVTFTDGWTTSLSAKAGVVNRYTTLEVDGRIFEDVITASCKNCGPLSEIVISRYLGVVAYKVDGVYWTMRYTP
jgi:hypothetical protein